MVMDGTLIERPAGSEGGKLLTVSNNFVTVGGSSV
jgi:hypothetical protein